MVLRTLLSQSPTRLTANHLNYLFYKLMQDPRSVKCVVEEECSVQGSITNILHAAGCASFRLKSSKSPIQLMATAALKQLVDFVCSMISTTYLVTPDGEWGRSFDRATSRHRDFLLVELHVHNLCRDGIWIYVW